MARLPFDVRQNRRLSLAINWLLAELQDAQPHDARELLRRAELAGHAQRTIQRASLSLAVKKAPRYGSDGKISGWTWTQTGSNHRKRMERNAYKVAP